MGMFDDIRYQGADYQTKSLDCVLAQFEIREDGSLWRETYRIEDRSDPNAVGLARLGGIVTHVPTGWRQEMLTGEVRFYGAGGDFVALYDSGQLLFLRPDTDE